MPLLGNTTRRGKSDHNPLLGPGGHDLHWRRCADVIQDRRNGSREYHGAASARFDHRGTPYRIEPFSSTRGYLQSEAEICAQWLLPRVDTPAERPTVSLKFP